MSGDVRRPAAEARPIADELVEMLRPHCEWIEVAGSLRRGARLIGDVEIVAIALPSYFDFTDQLLAQGIVTKAVYGESKSMRWGKKYRGMTYRGIKHEVYLCDHDNRGYLFWLRTGPDNSSDRANTYLVTQIKRRAMFQLEQGYVWHQGEKLRISTEQDFFSLMGVPFIEPAERSVKTYMRMLGKPDHQWGDINQFKEHQKTLFSLQLFREAEIAPKGDVGAPAKKAALTGFQWESPWLLPDGNVWIHTGYGKFEAMPPDTVRAQAHEQWLRQFPTFRESERRRLMTWLDVRAVESKWTGLSDVVAEMIAVLHLPQPQINKCLSLLQPWASLVAWREKQWETRSWKSAYRGPVVIHASQGWKPDQKRLITRPVFHQAIAGRDIPRGAALCIADLVDIQPTEAIRSTISDQEFAFGDYSDGRWAWQFENVRLFAEPIPATGKLQLFELELPGELQYAG